LENRNKHRAARNAAGADVNSSIQRRKRQQSNQWRAWLKNSEAKCRHRGARHGGGRKTASRQRFGKSARDLAQQRGARRHAAWLRINNGISRDALRLAPGAARIARRSSSNSKTSGVKAGW